MKHQWMIATGFLLAAGMVAGQEKCVGCDGEEGRLTDDPFGEDTEAAGCVTDDPFAEDSGGCDGAAEVEFAAEDTEAAGGTTDDPFAAASGAFPNQQRIPHSRLQEDRITLRVRMETWELDSKAVAAGLGQTITAADLGRRRQELLEDPGSVLVFSPALALEARSRASSGSQVERIYPTEMEPPDQALPTGGPSAAEAAPAGESTIKNVVAVPSAAATPSAFETRVTGVDFEVAVQPVTAEARCWDLSLSFEEVRLVAMETQGAESLGIRMPAFSMFRTGGLLRVQENEWQLLSVQAPPAGLEGERSGLSWVSLVKIERVR